MGTTNYSEPVTKLLTYGEPNVADYSGWPNYLEETSIGPEHISELLRMIEDKELRTMDPDEADPKYWGPVHAWRALGQLKAISAVKPLLDCAPALMDDNSDLSEWAIEELPDVYSLIGKDAIPLLAQYLADTSYSEEARVNLAIALSSITGIHPETREECIQVLMHQLETMEPEVYELNAYLILSLASLQAKEALPLIEKAFAAAIVETFIITLDDVLVKLGLKEATPVHSLSSLFAPPTTSPSEKYFTGFTPSTRSNGKIRKKAKQKMAKASRKKNRRK